jgi:hypothetical protein
MYSNYKDEELIAAYSRSWNSSQTEFCNLYGAKRSNFSQWLKGKKKSRQCSLAVIRWLSGEEPGSYAKENERLSTLPTLSASQLFNAVRLRGELSNLVFVDGDNTMGYMSYITQLFNPLTTHIIVNVSPTCYSTRHIRKEDSSWISLIRAKHNHRDAADVDLSFEAGAAHILLPPSVTFVLISSDHFVKELSSRLREERTVVVYKPEQMKSMLYKSLDNIHTPIA